MELKTILKVKWHALKRRKSFYGLLAINYFLFAFVDLKSICLMPSTEQYIARFLFQQIAIVFTSILFVQLVFNEKTLESIQNYMVIYVKNVKLEVFGSALFCILVNISAFIIGQLILLSVNYLYYGKILATLSLVNLIVGSLQIVITTLLCMSLRLLLKKDVFVFGLFYLTNMAMLAINNVYVSIPLTIKILGIEGNGYYVTYDWPLWAGKIAQLLVCIFLFNYALRQLKLELESA